MLYLFMLKKLTVPQACLREVYFLSCTDEGRACCTGHAEASGYNSMIEHFQGKSVIPLLLFSNLWGHVSANKEGCIFSVVVKVPQTGTDKRLR